MVNSRLRCFVNLTTMAGEDRPRGAGAPAPLATSNARRTTEDSRQWSALRLARTLVGFVVADLAELGVHDVIILDNLPPHKSAAARHAIEQRARRYSCFAIFFGFQPDRNAIAKLTAILREAAARTVTVAQRRVPLDA